MSAKIVYSNPPRYYVDGVEVSHEEFQKATPSRIEEVLGGGVALGPFHGKTTWPMRSDACAVHKDQIPEVMERNKRHGVQGVTYDPVDGTAIIESRGAQKDLIRAEGFTDKNGWFN